MMIRRAMETRSIKQMPNHPPKDTLPLGNYRGSGQHSDDYTAATSQFHHEFLHIPPPEHKQHQKLISCNPSNLKQS